MTSDVSKDGQPSEAENSPAGVRVSAFEQAGHVCSVMSFDVASSAAARFTVAEQFVLAGLVNGLSARQIARWRKTARRTVENQISSIFRKLNVRSRSELVVALALGTARPPH